MKRIITVLIILTAAASFSFADEGEESGTKTPPVKVVRETILRAGTSEPITGKVERVIFADLLTRAKSKIVITDASGISKEFVVKALAVVYDSTGKFMTLNDVKPGQEVEINYIAKPLKVREAVSIKIIK